MSHPIDSLVFPHRLSLRAVQRTEVTILLAAGVDKGANQYQLIAISIVYWQSVASVPALQANTISLRRAAGSYRDISGVLGTLIVTQVVLFTWLRGSVADPSLQL